MRNQTRVRYYLGTNYFRHRSFCAALPREIRGGFPGEVAVSQHLQGGGRATTHSRETPDTVRPEAWTGIHAARHFQSPAHAERPVWRRTEGSLVTTSFS